MTLQSTGDIKNLIHSLRMAEVESKTAQTVVDAVYNYAGLDKTLGGTGLIDLYAYLEEVYESSKGQMLTERLNAYISVSQGWFSVTECDKECQTVTKRDKDNRRQIFSRLVKKGILERHPTKNGLFRLVQDDATVIDWYNADVSNIYPIEMPFELERYVKLYPKNIGVIAAPPNAGKTAWLLDLIRRNCDRLRVHYFCSEMAAEELKVRLSNFTDVPENEWTFDPRERSSNFADVIFPDDLNIIDYIEMPEGNFYMVASEIRAIFDKLRKGLAFIALQKKAGVDYGRGGELSAEKARLYLTMDNNTLTIRKGKIWAQPGVNPNGMQFIYKLVNGAKFTYHQKMEGD